MSLKTLKNVCEYAQKISNYAIKKKSSLTLKCIENYCSILAHNCFTLDLFLKYIIHIIN